MAGTITLRVVRFWLLFVVTLPGIAAGAAPADVSGEWVLSVTSPHGTEDQQFLLLQEGVRVIGLLDSNVGSGRLVGSFDGTRLTFTTVLKFGGQPNGADWTATVDGDTLTGTVDFGDYGTGSFTGHRGRAEQADDPADSDITGSAQDAGLEVAQAGAAFGQTRDGLLIPEMLAVNGGSFLMGSDREDAYPEYSGVHEVALSAFRMSRFLITNAQYLAFCETTGYRTPMNPKGWGNYLRRMPNHPVVNVSWDDAKAYTDWLSEITGERFRVPTEAEWEYAARAGNTGRRYVWGESADHTAANTVGWHIGASTDRIGRKAWWDAEGEALSESQPMTTRVGIFAANDWGFYDMAGNVWEWNHDWFQADYYHVSPPQDPMGADSGTEKVMRGGSWYNVPDTTTIAARDWLRPHQRLNWIGFRVVAR